MIDIDDLENVLGDLSRTQYNLELLKMAVMLEARDDIPYGSPGYSSSTRGDRLYDLVQELEWVYDRLLTQY